MKLMTKTLEERFEKIGCQSQTADPIIIAKFFDPCGSATWYASEYDAENKIAFGYVTGLAFDEWGTFSITELESIKRPFGLGIERDLYFKEQRFKEIIKEQDLER